MLELKIFVKAFFASTYEIFSNLILSLCGSHSTFKWAHKLVQALIQRVIILIWVWSITREHLALHISQQAIALAFECT